MKRTAQITAPPTGSVKPGPISGRANAHSQGFARPPLPMLILVVVLAGLISRWRPHAEPALLPEAGQLAAMGLFHLAAVLVSARVWGADTLRQAQGPLRIWLVIGTLVLGLARPQGLPSAIAALVPIYVVVSLVVQREGTIQDTDLRRALRATLVLTLWSLLLMQAISPRQLASQLLPWTLGWCLLLSRIPEALTSDAYARYQRLGTAEGKRKAAFPVWPFWLGALILLALNLGVRPDGSDEPGVRILGLSLQPYAVAPYFAWSAISIRLAARRRLYVVDWLCNAGMFIAYLWLKELGTLTLYVTALALMVFLAEGTRTPDFRLLGGLAVASVLFLLLIAFAPLPQHGPLGRAAARFDHVRARMRYLAGDRHTASSEEQARVDLAVNTAGPLGRGGWPRYWMISKAAGKDYAVASVLVGFGWLGMLHILGLYALLFRSLVLYCLRLQVVPVVRYLLLVVVLAAMVQACFPILSHVRLLIPVGVPMVGIARGGLALLLFITGLIGLLAAERLRSSLPPPAAAAGEVAARRPVDFTSLRLRLVLVLLLLFLISVPLQLYRLSRAAAGRLPAGRRQLTRFARWLPEMRRPITDVHGHPVAETRLVDGDYVRAYPFGPATANLVGFAGHQTGELYLERYLTTAGLSLDDRGPADAWLGDRIFTLGETPELRLTIDAELQAAIYRQFEARRQPGCAVVMTPEGKIRALVSYPSFDPAQFLSDARYRTTVNQAATEVQWNRCLQPVPAASTLKPFLWLAHWEYRGYPPGAGVACGGSSPRGPAGIPCSAAHGVLPDWQSGIVHSCNHAALAAVDNLTPAELDAWLRRAGLSECDLEGLPGRGGRWDLRHPSRALWDTVALGQPVAISPLGLTRAYAMLANRGRLPRPTLIEAIDGKPGRIEPPQPVIARDHADQMLAALRRVVTEGTAASIRATPLCGKTGTLDLGPRLPGRASGSSGFFAWAAPYPAPRVVGLVFMEGSEDQPRHGYDAAELAASIYPLCAGRSAEE